MNYSAATKRGWIARRTQAQTPRERAIAYFHRTSGGDQQLFDDRLQRYDQNYNGMRDHWDRVLPFVLGLKPMPLNETRGEK